MLKRILFLFPLLFHFTAFASDDLTPIIPLQGHTLSFAKDASRPHLISGWSVDEATGVWTEGNAAKFRLLMPGKPSSDLHLILDAIPLLGGAFPSQEVEVSVNQQKLSTLTYVAATPACQLVVVPKAALSPGQEKLIEVDVTIKTPRSPIETGLNNVDIRKLGLFFRSVILKEVFYYVHDPSIPYQGVVTLGDSCLPKMQLEVHFKDRFGSQAKAYLGGRNLFDFMVPYKLDLLADAIGNKLVDCCTSAMQIQEMHWAKKNYTPVDRYELKFSHLFDLHPAVPSAKRLTQAKFNSHWGDPGIAPKVAYMKKKFLDNRNRCLYVLWGVTLSKESHFTLANIIKLRDTLAAVRGDANFAMLVFCTKDWGFKDQGNIMFRKLRPSKNHKLTDRVRGFKEIMDGFNFVPCPGAGE